MEFNSAIKELIPNKSKGKGISVFNPYSANVENMVNS